MAAAATAPAVEVPAAVQAATASLSDVGGVVEIAVTVEGSTRCVAAPPSGMLVGVNALVHTRPQTGQYNDPVSHSHSSCPVGNHVRMNVF